MKISKGSIIKLADGKEYLILNGKRITNADNKTKDFCLLINAKTDTNNPVEMRVAEIQVVGDNPKLIEYDGPGFDAILKSLLD